MGRKTVAEDEEAKEKREGNCGREEYGRKQKISKCKTNEETEVPRYK